MVVENANLKGSIENYQRVLKMNNIDQVENKPCNDKLSFVSTDENPSVDDQGVENKPIYDLHPLVKKPDFKSTLKPNSSIIAEKKIDDNKTISFELNKV